MAQFFTRLRLFALLAALLVALPGLGQNDWRPFRPGCTHYLSVGPAAGAVLNFRLQPGQLVGADSVYRFENFYRANDFITVPPLGCFQPNYFPLFWRDSLTEAGRALRLLPAGDFELLGRGGQPYLLRTRVPVGTTWPFGPGGQAATLVSRAISQLSASAPVTDSVLTIALTGGQQVVLSKKHGVVRMPDLRTWPAATSAILRFLAVPEAGIGRAPGHVAGLYNFQAGDEFLFREEQTSFGAAGLLCAETWTLTRYLSRRQTGDSLYLTGERQQFTQYSGAPSCPPADTVVGAVVPFAYQFYLRSPRAVVEGRQVTGRVLFNLGPLASTVCTAVQLVPTDSLDCYGGYRFTFDSFVARDSCSSLLLGAVDQGETYTLAEGLGLVSSGSSTSTGQLVWYKKGSLTCGARGAFPGGLLATPAPLAAEAAQLWPNPATAATHLRLHTRRGGALTVTVTDALGRRVWQTTSLTAPEADVALPVAAWRPGIYQLRVQLPEGARTLRLVRE